MHDSPAAPGPRPAAISQGAARRRSGRSRCSPAGRRPANPMPTGCCGRARDAQFRQPSCPCSGLNSGLPSLYSRQQQERPVAPDTSTATDADARAALADIERLGGQLRAARAAIGKVIYGQQDVIDQTLVALLSGGHLLLIGVPGLAKTKLVETLGVVLGMEAKRIQFTPDLMPADILGSEVMEESDVGRRAFRFLQGPAFAQLLMADEINRASPRTQSALLQSMQEKHVTVAGNRYDLPAPFHVLSTQNPLEQEGTYPLPEAQLDRFLLQVDVGYPDETAERQIMIGTTGAVDAVASQALTPADLMAAQSLVRRLPLGETVAHPTLNLAPPRRPATTHPPHATQ